MPKCLSWVFVLGFTFLCTLCVLGAETVLYENDFSDPATLSDFTQYRHGWEIRDGALRATAKKLDDSVSGAMSHLLYNAPSARTDYIVEVDYLHPASTGGIIIRADRTLASHENNGFYGYIGFVGSAADKGAFGYATSEGTWGGNINVGPVAFSAGEDIHIKITVKGDYVKTDITKLQTGELVYTYIYAIGAHEGQAVWNSGTVGIRTSGTAGAFDNFRITTANEVEEPSRVAASEYGEGMTFSANTGRYMLKKALSAMPMTWEASVYFPYDATAKYNHILLSNYERSVSGYLWEVTKAGRPALVFYNSSGLTRYTFNKVNVYCGEKMHIAIVTDVEKSEIRCYVDGVLAETQALTVDPKDYGVSYTNLGTDHRELNLHLFSGALLRIACYADVRTAEEIAADMTAPAADGLLLHYDTSTTEYGETVTDLSGKKNHAVYEHFWYDEIDNATDYAYSIAVVGDTQHNVQYQPETFAKLYDWLRANAKDRKIAFMLGLGDITNDNTEEQWAHSLANIAKLDGVIPYALSCGNHDGTADSYSEQFAGTAYAEAIGENCFGNLANSYQVFKVGNIHYLVLSLEYNPSEEAIAWAKGVAEAHPYHRVLVITHFNLSARGKLSAPGLNIWNGFAVDCPNVEMVFSGHVINDKILQNTTTGTAGNKVKHFMINGQSVDGMRIYEGKEAAGLVAMLYFDESGRNVTFEYYSTALDKYFMECNRFSATVGNLAGDTDFNGRITVADVLKILKAYVDSAVCYNGDTNGDLCLSLIDVLQTLRFACR